VACLFCGKEIGPIRLLRDKEFCSPKHRKEYKDRLRKVLVQVGEPETVPRGVAPFVDATRAHQGPCHRVSASFDFSSVKHRAQIPAAWTLAIPEAGETFFERVEVSVCELPAGSRAAACDAQPLPYFGTSLASRILSLPEPKLGAVILRSADGELLSGPIAVAYPVLRPGSRTAEAPAPVPVAGAASPVTLPGLTLPIAECVEPAREADSPPSGTWMAVPAPQPSAFAGQPSMSVPAPPALHVPEELPRPAVEAKPAAETIPPRNENWLPVPAPEPVVRTVQPAAMDALTASAKLRLPETLTAAAPSLRPAAHLAHLASAPPAAADLVGPLALATCQPISPSAAAPLFANFEIPKPKFAAGACAFLALSASKPAERHPVLTANTAVPEFSAGPLRLAALTLEAIPDPLSAPLEEAPVPAASARPQEAAAKAPLPQPIDSAPMVRKPSVPPPAATVSLPSSASTDQLQTEIPQAGLLPVNYHCALGTLAARPSLAWKSRQLYLEMPRFAVRPVFDRLEDPNKQKQERKRPAFAEIFTMPDAAALTKRKGARHAFTALAASVTVAMALWFGANAGKLGKDLINRQAAEEIAAAARAQAPGETSPAPNPPAALPPSPFRHPVAWIKTEAAKRATVQLSDTFENGMQAWGVKAKGWAAGWSHSSDGYVRPGQLALFQPTLNYTDYRMEFFGQIENKSMSWVVRGKDTQNYYAMKFNIVEPGLRPVIAMVHYPVIGGKQGHKVEVPLSVMVHNNTPYHVAVEVRGSHYTASIEGQEVDSWSDDTLLAGGVGFFADAGSRARIYWMKVSKNDDWLGRLCSQIAGSAGALDTASLQRPALPVPQPDQPAPMPASAALWPAELGEAGWASLQRGKSSVKGERERWSS